MARRRGGMRSRAYSEGVWVGLAIGGAVYLLLWVLFHAQ